MVNEILDLKFLYEVTNGEKTHISNVIDIFLDATDKALQNMEALIEDGTKWYELGRQAHAIKSSVHVVNIIGMYAQLLFIEKNAETNPDKQAIINSMGTITTLYNAARPMLIKLQHGEDIF